MATILLNVKVNQQDLKTAKTQIDGILGGNHGGSGGVQSTTANVDNLQKSVANLLNTLKGSESKYAPQVFEDLKKRVTSALNSVKSLNKEIGDNKPTKDQQRALTSLRKTYEQLGAEFATLRVESQKMQKENKLAIPNVDNLRKKYANLLSTIQGTEKYYAKGTFSNIANDAKKYLNELKELDPTQADYAERVNDLDKKLNRLSARFAETRQESENMHGSLLEITKGFLKFQLAAMLVMKPLQMIRDVWDSVNETLVETETRIVELNRVTNNMANSDELYSLAQRYGQTFENVSEITLNFARNGMSWAEALKATEAALLAINVAELDATQASEGMIAIMQQFGYQADELEGIVDKLNITADNAAVSTEKLLLALQRTGSSAKNAKLSLEETVGIITALSKATGRSGENLGTAVNSLIQFSTKESSLKTFAELGGEVERVVNLYQQGGATVLDIWRELSNVINSTQSAEGILGKGFTTEEFEALNEELREALGEEFAKTTEIYSTASTFRKNYFIALLNNLDQVQETLDDMNNSQGYSQQENLQYLDTYESRLNTLKSKWQEIANDEKGLLATKKGLATLATQALKLLDVIGGLRTLFIGVGLAAIAAFGPALVVAIKKVTAALTKASVAAATFQKAMGWVALAATAISAVIGIIETVTAKEKLDFSGVEKGATNLSELGDELNNISDEYSQLTAKIQEYRSILDSETSSTQQKEEAQNQLLTIQNQLKDSNNEYAASLDLINGKLEDEIELLDQEKYIKSQEAIKEFYKTSADAELAASEYLKSFITINFAEMQDAYSEGLLNQFIDKYGGKYGVEGYRLYAEDSGFWDKVWADLGGTFGGDTYVTGLSKVTTPENTKKILEGLLSEVDKSDYSDEEKLYIRGKIQSVLNTTFGSGSTYQQSVDFLYGNKKSDNFAEYLSNEQRKAIAEGTMSFEDFKKIYDEFYGISSGGSSPTPTGVNKDEIINKLEAIRENTEKTKDIEEKMLALEEAKNQRNVRVFNAATGQWEMVANEKAIADAEEALTDTALGSVLDFLKNGELPSDYKIPDWLQSLVAPTAEDEFENFLSNMGILAKVFDKSGIANNSITKSSTSNTTNNNQSYSINGISIGGAGGTLLRQNFAEMFDMLSMYAAGR